MIRCALALLVAATGAPENAELEALKKADQADRQFVSSPQEIDWARIAPRDAARQQRVRELLLADAVHSAQDFDNAALIMQHGSKPSDFLLAHELAAIAAYKGNFGSLVALAEDRWLDSLGRQQRWGSQFDWEGLVKPVARLGSVVTDQMRRDLLLPTLAEIDKHGAKAPMMDLEGKIAYIEKRMDASRWRPTLVRSPSLAGALETVGQQRLNTAQDYVLAARALLGSSDSDQLLLSHELAVLAMTRRHAEAPKLFRLSLDSYLRSTGLTPRYASGAVAPGVRRVLMASP